jgi:hypothetical protein
VVKFNVIEPSRFDYRRIVWAEDEQDGKDEEDNQPVAAVGGSGS